MFNIFSMKHEHPAYNPYIFYVKNKKDAQILADRLVAADNCLPLPPFVQHVSFNNTFYAFNRAAAVKPCADFKEAFKIAFGGL